ncbi:MAG: rhomboid family intramembrane serine protease [Alphaproteobacteria bacterium]|nr:rhomboid family intramembrane serine protease [Alphaproteobacteria bacterium]
MKHNGNGQDKDEKGKIIHFPSSAERDIHKKQKERMDQDRAAAAAKLAKQAQTITAPQPFFKFGNIPPFIRALAALFLLVHLPLYLLAGEDLRLQIFYNFGFIPGSYTGAFVWHWGAAIAPISYIFIHGSWMHLGFNLVMTLALGTFFEKTYGTRAAIIFFTLCCLASALTTLALNPFSTIPIIGASGGLSGWFAAILLMIHQQSPGARKKYGPWPIVFFWGLVMVLPGLLLESSALAWQAHLGGYLAGLVLFTLLQKGKIRL